MLAILRSRGLTKGLLDGDRRWLLVGAAAWAIRAVQWAWKKEQVTVYREELGAGETLVITRETPQAAKARRRS